jgi:hypothetical protein
MRKIRRRDFLKNSALMGRRFLEESTTLVFVCWKYYFVLKKAKLVEYEGIFIYIYCIYINE